MGSRAALNLANEADAEDHVLGVVCMGYPLHDKDDKVSVCVCYPLHDKDDKVSVCVCYPLHDKDDKVSVCVCVLPPARQG